MKITREELQKQIVRLNQSNEHYAKEDKRLRNEFAIIFKMTTSRYGGSEEPRDISWEQIFTKVGGLLMGESFNSLTGRISALNVKNIL